MKILKVEQSTWNDKSIVSIRLDGNGEYGERAEVRLIFNSDGTMRIISNLKVKQVKDLLKHEFGEHMRVQPVESFGYPED